MENRAIFSIIRSVLKDKGLEGKSHQDFIDRFIGNAELLQYLYSQLYSNKEAFNHTFKGILELIADSYIERSPFFKKRDKEKDKKDIWFLSNKLAGMSLYVDRFSGSLKAMPDKLNYLQDLGVNLLHLMPLFESPVNASDGGYAVSNYRVIDKRFGTLEDLKNLQRELQDKRHVSDDRYCFKSYFRST